jgi:hypothetical protein
MPDPREVVEHPEAHWDFFTVSDHVHEQADCCVYDARDLDRSTLTEFTKVSLLDSSYEYSNEELLYQVGAINRASEGYNFTNAGLLFFAANPQRVSAAAYIRLLRFETNVENMDDRGLPTFDRKFTGPITKRIRDIRTFFRESGFFKLYQRRNPDGRSIVSTRTLTALELRLLEGNQLMLGDPDQILEWLNNRGSGDRRLPKSQPWPDHL